MANRRAAVSRAKAHDYFAHSQILLANGFSGVGGGWSAKSNPACHDALFSNLRPPEPAPGAFFAPGGAFRGGGVGFRPVRCCLGLKKGRPISSGVLPAPSGVLHGRRGVAPPRRREDPARRRDAPPPSGVLHRRRREDPGRRGVPTEASGVPPHFPEGRPRHAEGTPRSAERTPRKAWVDGF